MKKTSKTSENEKGFTIVELMIALSIFSVILLIGTLVMVQIGKLYTKGLNQSNLQNASRNIQQDISSGIQFSSGDSIIGYTDPSNPLRVPITDPSGIIPSDIKAFCIGKTRYTYILNRKLGRDDFPTPPTPAPLNTEHVLWKDTLGTVGSCRPVDIRQSNPPGSGEDGYEMMPTNTRLTELSITTRNTGGFTVKVYAAHGDSDLIGVDGSRKPSCVSGKGSQFCAISILDTVVMPRL